VRDVVGAPTLQDFGSTELPVRSLNTLVVGSGAAARKAALQLLRLGVTDIALVTDRWNGGTSFDAGSDKQTYYKLGLSGRPDSATDLAHDLWAGTCMHGDIALCEAMGSARAFYDLVELGVPFPHDRYGGYPGYRTDHDQRSRATSAGPLTSKLMCERLGGALEAAGLRVFDRHQVVALLTREGESGEPVVCGAVAVDKERLKLPAGGVDQGFGLVVFNARNVILATGGPGGMYRDSVYPQSQRGSIGMALRIGAHAQNLTESQFGLASVGFRWNLSGSYQQVIPRYISTDQNGRNEKEFLNAHFPDMPALASAVFRKGYEWPFDSEKVSGYGSSLIDLLVFRETQAGRRVYLDFTTDASGGDGLERFNLEHLDDEARTYLENSGALADSPIHRLAALNQPSIDLFRSHGIDLGQDRLEIAVCAQHNNGGLTGNVWWESNVGHLFPIGEVCGTHGVRRPGGSALNAGQVGALRAASYIAAHYGGSPYAEEDFAEAVRGQVGECLEFAERVSGEAKPRKHLSPAQVITDVQNRMSRYGGHVRERPRVEEGVESAWKLVRDLPARLRVSDMRALSTAFWAADLALSHVVYLEAVKQYLEAGGGSRGSFLVLDATGELPCSTLEEDWRFAKLDSEAAVSREIQEVWVEEAEKVSTRWVPVRPVPSEEGWFEEIWKEYRGGRIIR